MDLSGIADTVTAFSRDNPIIAAAAGLLLLFLLIRKTKIFFFLLLLALVLAAALYLIMDVASIGKTQKKQMIERGSRPGMEDIR